MSRRPHQTPTRLTWDFQPQSHERSMRAVHKPPACGMCPTAYEICPHPVGFAPSLWGLPQPTVLCCSRDKGCCTRWGTLAKLPCT